MKRKSGNSLRLFVIALSVLGFLPGIVLADHAKGPRQELVVFGDSLSDPGNIYLLTGQVATAPYEVIPGAPYDIGGNRFTNGRTWAEALAARIAPREGRGGSSHPFFNSKTYNDFLRHHSILVQGSRSASASGNSPAMYRCSFSAQGT